MKNWRTYLPAYLPPLLILSFLLLTNLFTRSRVLRGLLFPERSIVISAEYDDNQPDDEDSAPLPDGTDSEEEDSSGCDEPAYLQARTAYLSKEYAASIRLWTAMLDSSSCSRSSLLNSIGIAYLKSSGLHNAHTFLRKAVQADSSNARAWYNLGLCRSRQGYSSQARNAYLRAVALNPGMNKAHFNLGVLSLNRKNYTEAREHFRTALTWGSDKAISRYNIGLSYQREGLFSRALAEYRECIRFAPGQITARLRIAELFLANDQIDSAIIIARQASVIEPENPDILIRIAKTEIAGKQFDAAMADLDQADKLRPGAIEITYQRARIFGLKGEDKEALRLYRNIMTRDPSNPRVYYNIAVNLMDLGMDHEALDAYAQSLKTDPTYWKSAYNLGVYYLRKKRYSEAKQFFRHVVEITPERPQAHYNLGLSFLKAGNFTDAQASFLQSVRLDSTYVEGRYNLALTLLKNGENDSAKSVFQSVLRFDPNHAKTYYNLGLIHRRAGEYREADNNYLRAIRSRTEAYPSAWYNRALCKRDLGQLDSALIFVRQATGDHETRTISAKALLLQVRLFDTLGFADSVAATLLKADSLCKHDPDALQELAEFYAQKGIPERSLAIYRQIIARNKQNTDLLLAVANLESKNGNPDSAEVLYQTVIDQDNRNTDALKNYARLLLRLQRNEDALRTLQKAIFLDPASPEARLETALIYAGENRTDEYKRELDKLRRIPMSNTETFSAGKKLFKAQLCTDALWFLQHAAEGTSDNADIRYLLLQCREQTDGSGFNPVVEWTAFIRDFPRFSNGYLNLAKALVHAGSLEPARTCLDTLLTIHESAEARLIILKVCLDQGDSACVEEQTALYLKNNPEERERKELYAVLSKKS